MFCTDLHTSRLLRPILLFSGLMLVASFASARTPAQPSLTLEPEKANFILGMDVDGQRLNLYRGCEEGHVTCDNMVLVAPDLGRMLQTKVLGQRSDKSPYEVKTYPTQTKHSTCDDGTTPCAFQGYTFSGKDLNGFIDSSNNKIHVASKQTTNSSTFSYKGNTSYLPLVSQASLVDSIYNDSDQQLNDSYSTVRQEVERLYGEETQAALVEEQIQWIKQPSIDCGADSSHLPRTQAEKVCFIQKNNTRAQA